MPSSGTSPATRRPWPDILSSPICSGASGDAYFQKGLLDKAARA